MLHPSLTCSTNMGARASTGQAETKELLTGGRSMTGLKNNHTKIKVLSCSLQDGSLPFSATLRTKDLDGSTLMHLAPPCFTKVFKV